MGKEEYRIHIDTGGTFSDAVVVRSDGRFYSGKTSTTYDSLDWYTLREFYCPGCGTQVEVETTPHGTPILRNYGSIGMDEQETSN